MLVCRLEQTQVFVIVFVCAIHIYIFKSLKYYQKSASACGVFAAAYAITLVLHRDPSQMNFKICLNGNSSDEAKFLRGHLLKIVEDSKLSLFPEHGY